MKTRMAYEAPADADILKAYINKNASYNRSDARNGVRIASASVQGGSYYVLAGRSLKTTERTIASFSKWVAGLWIIALLLISAGYRLTGRKPKSNQPSVGSAN